MKKIGVLREAKIVGESLLERDAKEKNKKKRVIVSYQLTR